MKSSKLLNSRRASVSGRKLYNPYAEDEDIPNETNSKRCEFTAKDTEVKLRSRNTQTKHTNSSIGGDFNQSEGIVCKDVNNLENAKNIKLLFTKIMSMEKQISETSKQFTIDIKNLEISSRFQEESYWQIKINSYLRLAKKYCEYIHLSYSSAVKHDIETKCWKIAFYSLIEQFRQAISLERRQFQNKILSSTVIL
ncbi:6840_t:CDS:2, partial [Scutellospora calospora]